jgi:hypothetical protein
MRAGQIGPRFRLQVVALNACCASYSQILSPRLTFQGLAKPGGLKTGSKIPVRYTLNVTGAVKAVPVASRATTCRRPRSLVRSMAWTIRPLRRFG